MSEKEISDKMKEITSRIKERRIELDMSYQALADKVGISKSTLQRYETGSIRNMPIDKLEQISEALHVTPDYIMGWENENKTAEILIETYNNDVKQDNQLKRIMEYYKRLSQSDKDMLENIARRCAEIKDDN